MSSSRFVANVLVACSLVLVAPAAFAGGPVCLDQGGTLVVLTKPKLPKGPFSATPLLGVLDLSPEAPLMGTLARGLTGSLRGTVTYARGDGVTCFAHLTVDETDFSATGLLECTDDLQNDVPITWTPTDC
jgi:hypothetical protein